MIQLETDNFSINVPVKQRMSADEFLAIADKLVNVQRAQSLPPVNHDSPAAYALDHGQELHNIHTKLQDQMEQLRKQEESITAILDYLESVERRRQ
jgi:hypothetical protein